METGMRLGGGLVTRSLQHNKEQFHPLILHERCPVDVGHWHLNFRAFSSELDVYASVMNSRGKRNYLPNFKTTPSPQCTLQNLQILNCVARFLNCQTKRKSKIDASNGNNDNQD